MPVSRDTAESLSKKLQGFRDTLQAEEQEALDNLMRTATLSIYSIRQQRSSLSPGDVEHPGGDLQSEVGVQSYEPNEWEQLDEILDHARQAAGPEDVNVFPWTTITTVTITASHPAIGC